MSKSKLIKKGVRVLKKQGPKTFAKKSAKFIKNKSVRTVYHALPVAMRKRIDLKNQEYNFISNNIFQIDSRDIAKSQKVTSGPTPESIQSATWFVPHFDHLAFGGIYTIFRFIEYFALQGVHNRLVIYDNYDLQEKDVRDKILKSFPKMTNLEIVIFNQETDSLEDLPETDIAVCTFWVSAYFLLKFNKTRRKYYFIQDYEPLFYAGGATFALAESTYRFGFRGIVNTPGLLAAVHQRHGIEGISFIPSVDKTLYYPDETDKSNKRVKIFFYARPLNPRNAFNLGIQIIKQLQLKYKDKIEIVTAGADWKERQYGLYGTINNKGLLKTLPEVADLYRECDIGFVYMLSKHPSYQPFEFMASGMATVSNFNEDNLWFLKHESNCLLAEPSPKAMVEQISRLIDDVDLRNKIIANGIKTVDNEWETQLSIIWNDLTKSK